MLWKSERPISKVFVFWNDLAHFIKNKSTQGGLFEFLKQVGFSTTLGRLYGLYNSSKYFSESSQLRSPKPINYHNDPNEDLDLCLNGVNIWRYCSFYRAIYVNKDVSRVWSFQLIRNKKYRTGYGEVF